MGVPKGDLTIAATVRLPTRLGSHVCPRSAMSAVNQILQEVAWMACWDVRC